MEDVPGDGQPLIVLDDDPTGVQAVTRIPVLLRWEPERIARAARPGPRSLHLMTNARALTPERAEEVTHEAARAAHEVLPGAQIVLRGDSTLRGHLLQEYRAVTRAAFTERPPVLVLVPALPAAGRITRDGIHWLETPEGRRVPLSETEYARDGDFSYSSSRLLEWAEERSDGLFVARDGRELPLATLRERGGDAVAEMIAAAAAAQRPAACAPDAETIADLDLIARGVRRAGARRVPLLVRCAPAFAGVLPGTLSDRLVAPPAGASGRVLVVCGSYVSGTTRQLEHLCESSGIAAIEPDVRALASDDPGPEIERVAARASEELDARGLTLVATPRERPPDLVDLGSGERIARGLAGVVASTEPPADTVIAKGGITSQIVLEDGLGAHDAQVVGPVAAGVSLWNVRSGGRPVAYLVFPGNVGGPAHLTDVVRRVREA